MAYVLPANGTCVRFTLSPPIFIVEIETSAINRDEYGLAIVLRLKYVKPPRTYYKFNIPGMGRRSDQLASALRVGCERLAVA